MSQARPKLTAAEVRIVDLIARGWPIRRIAELYDISAKEVKAIGFMAGFKWHEIMKGDHDEQKQNKKNDSTGPRGGRSAPDIMRVFRRKLARTLRREAEAEEGKREDASRFYQEPHCTMEQAAKADRERGSGGPQPCEKGKDSDPVGGPLLEGELGKSN